MSHGFRPVGGPQSTNPLQAATPSRFEQASDASVIATIGEVVLQDLQTSLADLSTAAGAPQTGGPPSNNVQESSGRVSMPDDNAGHTDGPSKAKGSTDFLIQYLQQGSSTAEGGRGLSYSEVIKNLTGKALPSGFADAVSAGLFNAACDKIVNLAKSCSVVLPPAVDPNSNSKGGTGPQYISLWGIATSKTDISMRIDPDLVQQSYNNSSKQGWNGFWSPQTHYSIAFDYGGYHDPAQLYSYGSIFPPYGMTWYKGSPDGKDFSGWSLQGQSAGEQIKQWKKTGPGAPQESFSIALTSPPDILFAAVAKNCGFLDGLKNLFSA
jgi:hypothetical protein